MERYETVCGQLREKHGQVSRGQQLRAMLPELQRQREALAREEEALQAAWSKEARDVEKLERGLTGFLASLRGGKEERLEQEQSEQRAAKARYDAKVRERADTEQRIARLREELKALQTIEAEYQALLEEKSDLLIQRPGPSLEPIARRRKELEQVRGELRTVLDALEQGEDTQSVIDQTRWCLDKVTDATSYSYDWVRNGMQRGAAELAQQSIENLKRELERFREALGKVQMSLYTQTDSSTELVYSISEWTLENRVANVLQSVLKWQTRVRAAVTELRERRDALQKKEAELARQWAALVVEA